MSNIVYDLAFPITYNQSYMHYIPGYRITIKPYKTTETFSYWDGETHTNFMDGEYEARVSFDDGKEITVTGKLHYSYKMKDGRDPKPALSIVVQNTDPGPFSTMYVRNPHPDSVTFNSSNTSMAVFYPTKALFGVQFNSTGFAANQNASFRCSSIQQNCLEQYSWDSATVYYKKSTDESYQSVSGTLSGTWSDVNVATGISLQDGYTYNVYITAVADDGTTASTEVANFTTTDAAAVATCIAPVGAFTSQDITFIWAHSTSNGTPQYAYDLQYSSNNGSSWTTVKSHEVTSVTSTSSVITSAGQYIWRVRTYNSNDVVGEWASGAFVNNAPTEPPANLIVTSAGRPTVSWTANSQTAYQVQVLSGDTIVHDSGAVYSPQMSYLINQYFDDNKAYQVRVRVYNGLGEVSDWVSQGYQQPSIQDVEFTVRSDENGGATIIISNGDGLNYFNKFYILRNNKPIALLNSYGAYYDRFAVGDTSYSVVAVDYNDQSDIQSKGIKILYPRATIVTLSGESYFVNERVNETYAVQTSVAKDYNQALYIGESNPSHYPSKMVVKSFSVTCFDRDNNLENLLGQVVFYADNFGNGGYCFVSNYGKTDSYLEMLDGTYANEAVLLLEVTNYDDSIEYEL